MRRKEPWGVSRALQTEVSPGVGATSLLAAPRAGVAQRGASEQDEATAPRGLRCHHFSPAPPHLSVEPSCLRLLFGDDFRRGIF